MVLHIAKQKTVFSFLINEMAQALGVVKLSIPKRPFFVPDLAIPNSFNKLVGFSVKNEVPIVGTVSYDE